MAPEPLSVVALVDAAVVSAFPLTPAIAELWSVALLVDALGLPFESSSIARFVFLVLVSGPLLLVPMTMTLH